MPNWLTLQLRKHGLPVVCVDARHAKAALSLQLNNPMPMTSMGWPSSCAPVGSARSPSRAWHRVWQGDCEFEWGDVAVAE
jgi:hypothetical protein